MARMPLDQAADLTAADVTHKRFSALPAGATVAEVREWFAASTHRRLAFLASDRRYAGSLTRGDLDGELDPSRPAAEIARPGPIVPPDAPARTGYELAVATDIRRVPVVDRCGALIGVLAVTEDLAAFCGADES